MPLAIASPARVEGLGLSPSILKKLDESSGVPSYSATPLKLSDSLLGQSQKVVPINLQRAVITTVNANMTVQFARLAPAIGEARIAQAQAAFDWTVFAQPQFSITDRPEVRTGGLPPRVSINQSNSTELVAGVRKRLDSGGAIVFQQQLSDTDDRSPDRNPFPDPSRTATFVAQLDQPLLRGFGTNAALAEIRLATNANRDEIQQLKATLTQQIVEAEVQYWQLFRAANELRISQRLLERGEEVRQTLSKRQRTAEDVRASQFSDAVATVEARRADVIRSENSLRTVSDQLKGLMNDPDLTLGSEALLTPVDQPINQSVQFTLADVLTTALQNRPEVQRALLAVSDSNIRQQLADNQRLPQLDLRLQARATGLNDKALEAIRDMSDAKFLDLLVGFNFERPIGNRAAEANYRQRTLETMQAHTTYREVVQRIILDVKSSLRSVVTSFTLIEQTKASRLAAAENLRTLEVEEKTIQALSPEFLDLKLRRQQALASAEAQELAAITEYNASLARLYGSMGIALERNRINFNINDAATNPDASLESLGSWNPIVTEVQNTVNQLTEPTASPTPSTPPDKN